MTDVTLISYAKMHTCLQAADTLAQQASMPKSLICGREATGYRDNSAFSRKTGRVVVVHEAAALCGVGAEVAALVADQAFAALKAPVRRITSPDVPTPASYALEQAFLPQASDIVASVHELMRPQYESRVA
jgi:pyruvate dehydrogenase E1 component beta subunit